MRFHPLDREKSRNEFKKAQLNPEKIPPSIKRLIALENYPEKLLAMVQKAVA